MRLGMALSKFGWAVFVASLLTVWASSAYADILADNQDRKDEKHFVVFTGVDASDIAWYAFLGGIYSPFGDIRETGFLVRAMVGFGEYDYKVERSVPNGTPFGSHFDVHINGDIIAGDVMAGYQFVVDRFVLRGFVGANVSDHDLSPSDPGNPIRGTEGGFKGQVEIFAPLGQAFWVNAMGSYATTHDNYWSRGRIGYQLTNGIAIGPETVFMGNERFDQYRIGGFVSANLIGDLSATLSGGYADDNLEGDTGYGALSFAIQF